MSCAWEEGWEGEFTATGGKWLLIPWGHLRMLCISDPCSRREERETCIHEFLPPHSHPVDLGINSTSLPGSLHMDNEGVLDMYRNAPGWKVREVEAGLRYSSVRLYLDEASQHTHRPGGCGLARTGQVRLKGSQLIY